MLMAEKRAGAAAIASSVAAEFYCANIVRKSIEDDRENFTRIFQLEKPGRPGKFCSREDGINYKTSVAFTVRNVPGALFKCLSALALRDLNMTKIESRPLRGKPWEYLFYLDFLGHPEEQTARNALGHLGEVADMLRILGCYPAAR